MKYEEKREQIDRAHREIWAARNVLEVLTASMKIPDIDNWACNSLRKLVADRWGLFHEMGELY